MRLAALATIPFDTNMASEQVLQKAICPERRKGLDSAASAIASVTEVRISNDLQVRPAVLCCGVPAIHASFVHAGYSWDASQLLEQWLLLAAGCKGVCVDIQRPAGQGCGHRSARQAAGVRPALHRPLHNHSQSKSTASMLCELAISGACITLQICAEAHWADHEPAAHARDQIHL